MSFPLAKRRREIVLHALHVGAMDTEDRNRWLIAWVWSNPKVKDQIWSVMNAAQNMGGKITEAEASAITEEASITRKHLSADNLARFLGVTYAQRQFLGLSTIGAIDVNKRERKVRRKRLDRLYQERRRRARGARPHSQSLSRTEPWRELGMSRRTWYRRNKPRRKFGTTSSATIFFFNTDGVVPPERKRPSEGALARPKQPSRAATTMAADRFEALPVELRLMALGLPIREKRRAAA